MFLDRGVVVMPSGITFNHVTLINSLLCDFVYNSG